MRVIRLLFSLSVCLVVRLSTEAIAKGADAKTDRQTSRQTNTQLSNKKDFSSAATLKNDKPVTAPALRPQNSQSSQITVTASRVCQHHVTSLSAKSVCQITLNDNKRHISVSVSVHHKCVSVTFHHKYVNVTNLWNKMARKKL